MVLFFAIISWIASAFVAGSFAESKGCSDNAWSILGFFIGPIAVIGAAGLPDRKLRKTLILIAEVQGINVSDSKYDTPKPRSNNQ